MTEDISQKVINIFSKHKNDKSIEADENVIKYEDGIYCICIKHDKHGNNFDENHLVEKANESQYIVKIMNTELKSPQKSPFIYNYKVPGDKLEKFLTEYMNKKIEGKIIEIEKYVPTDLA